MFRHVAMIMCAVTIVNLNIDELIYPLTAPPHCHARGIRRQFQLGGGGGGGGGGTTIIVISSLLSFGLQTELQFVKI